MKSTVELVSSGKASGEMSADLASLKTFYVENFKRPPEFVVRAPGRVNLIGEHIDYCGYSVLPMALCQSILMAVGRSSPSLPSPLQKQTVSLCNVQLEYSAACVDCGDICGTLPNLPSWTKYVLTGIRGVLEHFHLDVCQAVGGLQLAVSGSVPPSSGLSSSSALVCASAVAVAHLNQVECDRHVLADLCARAERFVGTEGGGMDQAICLLAEKGGARHIEFSPLRVHSVRLPRGACFVIANCLAEKNKAASNEFNCRVVECRLACHILAKHSGLNWSDHRRLGDLQTALGIDFEQMLALADRVLNKDEYSKQEVCEILGTDSAHLSAISLTANTQHIDSFKLRQRALHVFGEAARVWRFRRVCESVQDTNSALTQLGQLMNESHVSCRDLYECSHPRLDLLCRLAAPLVYGIRLTGAGWGGCCVALVSESRLQQFIDEIKSQFFVGHLHCNPANLDTAIFASQPEDGAQIFVMS